MLALTIYLDEVLTLTSQIDWNKVARDPILSQEITNGHAARMRYSRFKKQMDGTTSMPTRPRKTATPRRSRVEKKKPTKREPKFKTDEDNLSNVNLPIHMKTEPQDAYTRTATSMSTVDMDHNNTQSTLDMAKFEPTDPATPHFQVKTEPDFSIPDPTTPSETSRLPTPFLMDSPTSPDSPTFPTPGVVSLNSSMSSSASLNNCLMGTSFFGPPIFEPAGYKESMGHGRRGEMRYCFNPWEQGVDGFGNISTGSEGGDSVMFKREDTYDNASYGPFWK